MEIVIVRVYADPGRQSGEYRVLVDRLWPRGMRAGSIDFDEWAKDLAPSGELRRWFGHDPRRFEQFASRYRDELARPDAIGMLSRLGGGTAGGRLVLLTATRDVTHSGAAVLRDVLAG